MDRPAESEGELFADPRPSFAPLQGPGEGHVGVIDVGSNSVRFVVFEGRGRSPAPLYNEKVLCGLGRGLAETGRLDPEGRERTRAALARFARLAGGMGVGALAGVATSAVRDAADGPEFRALIERETLVRLRVVTGEEEARLAALGVIFGQPDAAGTVADLGGASLELCRVGEGRVGPGISMPLGPLRFADAARGQRRRDIAATARADLAPVAPRFTVPGGTLYLVGGSWRTLGRVHMHRSRYPVPILHEYETAADAMAETARWAADAPQKAIAEVPGVAPARLANLPGAAAILAELIAALAPARVTISGFGLREGVCFSRMPPEQRALDPLLEACREQERRRARLPGFGAELGQWMIRFLAPTGRRERRLLEAAGYLADVNWRAHPEYRAAACVEAVTQLNLTGGGHGGRGFLAAALLSRHKIGRRAAGREPLSAILDERARSRAGIAGRAMRLGAALCGAAPGVLGGLPLLRTEGGIVLHVPPGAARLVTGEVEKRLAAVAEAMECGWRIGAP